MHWGTQVTQQYKIAYSAKYPTKNIANGWLQKHELKPI